MVNYKNEKFQNGKLQIGKFKMVNYKLETYNMKNVRNLIENNTHKIIKRIRIRKYYGYTNLFQKILTIQMYTFNRYSIF